MSVLRTNRKLKYMTIFAVLFTALVVTAALPSAAQAASICYVDADAAGPTHNGLSWTTAFTTLTEALASTECTQEIWVASGTYVPDPSEQTVSFNLPDGVAIYGGFAGTETALSERVLHLDDADFTNDSILSGEIGDPADLTDNSQHIVRLNGAELAATRLDGFVIQDGYSDEANLAEGAGMFAEYSVATLTNLLFRNNYSIEKGGALSSAYSQLTVGNIVFDHNTSGIGGGLHDHEGASTYTHLTFTNNQAGSGGGAYFYASTSTLTDSQFAYNSATQNDGGALAVVNGSPSFSNSTFEYNRADVSDTSRGGAISVAKESSPTFTNITVSNNHSNKGGGGIYTAGQGTFTTVLLSDNMTGTLDDNGNPVIASMGGGIMLEGNTPALTNLYLFNNTASNMGGGIANSYAASPTITNSIFEGNTSVGGGGGGMMVTGPHSSPSLINCTFVNNATENGQGGALFAYGGGPEATVRVFNNIFWGNTRGRTPVPNQIYREDPSQLAVTYSDIQGGYTGSGNIDADPLFSNSEESDFHLNYASPAIDAGDNNALPDGITTDYDGQPRLVDLLNAPDTGAGTAPFVDMGAFEAQAPNLVVDKTASPATAPEGSTVTYTITVQNTGAGTAHLVSVSDPLPAGLERLSAPEIDPAGAGTAGTEPLLFENITLEGNQSVTIRYTARGLDGPSTVDNTVTVIAAEIPAPGVTDAVTLTVDNVAPIVDAGEDVTINEGGAAHFSGNYIDPAGSADGPFTSSWSFSDSPDLVTGTLTTDRLYPADGEFTATLSVTDADEATGTDTLNITVLNVAPIVDAGEDVTINEGGSVVFAATASDPGGETLTYTWNFDDGSPAVTGTLEPSHTFVDDGVYDVTLTVSDGDGGVTVDHVTVTVQNVAPTATAGADQSANEGEEITFSGSATDPGVNDVLSYSWNFGDGTPAVNSQEAMHTFTDNGEYHVILTVTDGDDGSDTDELVVTVANLPPTANAGSDQTVNEMDTVSFSGQASDPGAADILTYAWDFGDGQTATGTLTPTHVYVDNDTYTVTLTVTDDEGGTDTDELLVTVNNVAPVADAGNNLTGVEGEPLHFNGQVHDISSADTLTYAWDFGDGSTAVTDTLTPTHAYADNGVYIVTLTVTDDDHGEGPDTLTVTIANVAPQNVDAGSDQIANEGASVAFTGNFTDPGVNDNPTIAWDFGDGQTATGSLTLAHTYADNDTYTVKLTVTDKDGGVGSDTLLVTVHNVVPEVDAGNNLTINPGEMVTLSGSFIDPAGDLDALFTISWDFGDGSPAVTGTLTPSHTFALPGTYTVVLRVTDKDGGVGEGSITVAVNQFFRYLPLLWGAPND